MKVTRFYNVLFPIWLLVWLPSPLWILLIPGNYLIDFLVLRHCQKKLEIEDEGFLNENTWKVCLAGFFSDFLGAAFLFGWMMWLGEREAWLVSGALNLNIFRSGYAIAIMILAIFLSGLMIYLLDLWILKKKIGREKSAYTALRMALFTAPYLFLLPMDWFYR